MLDLLDLLLDILLWRKHKAEGKAYTWWKAVLVRLLIIVLLVTLCSIVLLFIKYIRN